METINENEAQDKRNLKKAFLAVVCACALTLAGVFAYLTATDQVKNLFSLADKIEIEVVEPNWNPDDAKGMLPTQTVAKDPAIHNKNKAEIYVFADVVIPQKDIVTANADGTLNEPAVVDLFSYELNDGWTLKDTITDDDGTITYRYVYNDVVPADGTTPSIFDEVTLVNYVNEQFNTEELAQQIVINGYGAQALGFANADEAYAAQFGEKEKIFTADITVNDDSIKATSEYEVKQVETLSIASFSTAAIDDQVVFEDVELIEDVQYAIVPAGESVDNAIAEFTADEAIMSAAASSEGVVLGEDNRTAFAVYSADDNSLNFYKRASVPTAGEQFEGKTVSNVYTGFETETYKLKPYGSGYETTIGASYPWYDKHHKIQSVSIVDAGIAPVSTAYWFYEFDSLNSVQGIADLNTASTSNMAAMFYSCNNLKTLDLTDFRTSTAENLSDMFYGDSQLTSIAGIENLDTSRTIDFSTMFYSCGVSSFDLSSWNTSSAKDLTGMFATSSVTSVNLSGWDISHVENMSEVFDHCQSLVDVNLSGWNTSSVTNMYCMFNSCSALSFDCSSWNVSSVSNHAGFNSDAPGVTAPAWTN